MVCNMTLPFPFPIYGTVTGYYGSVISGAIIEVRNTSNNTLIDNASTNNSGKYNTNIQNYSSVGDSIRVLCKYGISNNGMSGKWDYYDVVITDFGKQIDLNLIVINYNDLYMSGASYDNEIYLNPGGY